MDNASAQPSTQNTFNYHVEKLTRTEQMLVVGMAAVTVISLVKIRTQHKELLAMIKMAESAVKQLEHVYAPPRA